MHGLNVLVFDPSTMLVKGARSRPLVLHASVTRLSGAPVIGCPPAICTHSCTFICFHSFFSFAEIVGFRQPLASEHEHIIKAESYQVPSTHQPAPYVAARGHVHASTCHC